MRFEAREPAEAINYSRDHPLRELAVLLAAAVAGLAALFYGLGVVGELAAARIPPAWEARLFGGDWFEAGAASDRSTALERLVADLAAQWPGNPYDLRVRLLEDETPNALALPGGVIVVTTGLTKGAESENELAFVLAHELGHFANRDHLRAMGRAAARQAALGLFGQALGLDSPLTELVEALSERSFSRGQERQADRFALELVAGLYGHVGGATAFFERMADEAGSSTEVAQFFSTHPLSRDRVDAIEEVAQARGWPLEGALRPPLVE